MRGTAVGVIAKAPEVGRVKTRFCPPLTPAEAALVARALLADTVRCALATPFDVWCVATGDPQVLRGALPCALPLLTQHGHGLAERLMAAQADLFAEGYDRVVLLGGDCPTVEPAYLAASVSALDTADVVLGRVVDGGYSLIATAAAHPELFGGVAMSTKRTLDDTIAAATGSGLSTRVLPARHDLDTVADLAAASASGQLDAAPATRAILAGLAALAGVLR